jgi:predicted RNase H-like HicB family nuclease
MAANRRTAAAGRKFKVVLIASPDGGYSVEVPELPGCFTEGDTYLEAMKNAREAIECYLEPDGRSPSRKVLIKDVVV